MPESRGPCTTVTVSGEKVYVKS